MSQRNVKKVVPVLQSSYARTDNAQKNLAIQEKNVQQVKSACLVRANPTHAFKTRKAVNARGIQIVKKNKSAAVKILPANVILQKNVSIVVLF